MVPHACVALLYDPLQTAIGADNIFHLTFPNDPSPIIPILMYFSSPMMLQRTCSMCNPIGAPNLILQSHRSAMRIHLIRRGSDWESAKKYQALLRGLISLRPSLLLQHSFSHLEASCAPSQVPRILHSDRQGNDQVLLGESSPAQHTCKLDAILLHPIFFESTFDRFEMSLCSCKKERPDQGPPGHQKCLVP